MQAKVSQELGRHTDSITHWRAALKMDPGNPLLEKELAISLRLNEDYEQALPIVERLLKKDPKSAELNYLMGQILLNAREAAQALPHLEASVAAEPDFPPARGSLGLALMQSGQAEEAIPHLVKALPADTDGSFRFRLARAYQTVGDMDRAKEMMKQYQDLQRSAAPAEAQITPP
jgi:predicted Zn-dependent protease